MVIANSKIEPVHAQFCCSATCRHVNQDPQQTEIKRLRSLSGCVVVVVDGQRMPTIAENEHSPLVFGGCRGCKEGTQPPKMSANTCFRWLWREADVWWWWGKPQLPKTSAQVLVFGGCGEGPMFGGGEESPQLPKTSAQALVFGGCGGGPIVVVRRSPQPPKTSANTRFRWLWREADAWWWPEKDDFEHCWKAAALVGARESPKIKHLWSNTGAWFWW